MDLVIKQYIDRTETVSSSLIDALYYLTKPDPITGQSLANAVFVGRLQAPAAYEDAVNFLNTQFSSAQDNGSDFQITVLNNNYYIRFADPEVVRVLTEKGVMQEGEGLTVAQAADSNNPTSFNNALFRDNTDILSFDEIRYFTKWLTGQSHTDGLFYRATNLESIDLTNATILSRNICEGCTSLTYFNGRGNTPNTLHLPNLVSLLNYAHFQGCTQLKYITSLGQLSTIGDDTFRGCTSLETVVLPQNLTRINAEGFYGCTSLSTINLTNVTNLQGRDVFNGCSSLEYCDGPNSTQGELNLPNLTGTLGDGAFKGCIKLTSITSLGSATSIGSEAFRGCTNLATINFPSTLTSVGSYAFDNTAWYNGKDYGNVLCGSNIYYKYKRNGQPSSITVTVPEGVTYMCADCISAGGGYYPDLTITLPSTLKTLQGIGFMKIASLTVPSSVENIINNCFNGCTLNTVVVEAGNTVYDSRDNCNAIIETATNTMLHAGTLVTFPSTVTKIADRCFRGGTGTLTIPNTVTTIGAGAFGSTSYNHIIIPNSVTSMGNRCCFQMTSLQTITIGSGLQTLQSEMFVGATNLTTVTLSEGLLTIKGSCFKNTKSLYSITIPNSVTSIEGRVFSMGDVDTSQPDAICLSGGVTFGTGLTKIVSQTFMKCKFTSLDLPANITTIENYAIDNCAQLQSIIMRGVTSIGDKAFRGSALATITIETPSVPTISGTSFANDNGQYINSGNFTIYVPSNLLSSYETAPNWSTLYNDGKIQPISI